MLDNILRWLGAFDSAVTTMGPGMAIVIAMLGASGITQVLKFPIAQLFAPAWAKWLTRLAAMVLTFLLLHWLAYLPPALEVAIGAAQPYVYTGVMALIRHRWPWLEATKALGSAQPSEGARMALFERRDSST